MTCYRLVNGELEETEDPILTTGDEEGLVQAIHKTGYLPQLETASFESNGADISLFESDGKTVPRYYISCFGSMGELASFVAHDFPELLKLLKAISPLISLVGLDQQTDIQAEAIMARPKGD